MKITHISHLHIPKEDLTNKEKIELWYRNKFTIPYADKQLEKDLRKMGIWNKLEYFAIYDDCDIAHNRIVKTCLT